MGRADQKKCSERSSSQCRGPTGSWVFVIMLRRLETGPVYQRFGRKKAALLHLGIPHEGLTERQKGGMSFQQVNGRWDASSSAEVDAVGRPLEVPDDEGAQTVNIRRTR